MTHRRVLGGLTPIAFVLLALSDGTILHTTNGGKTWQETFRP